MTLKEFNSKYVYKSDTNKFGTRLDIWEIIKPDENGMYYGDCESYCLTIQELIPEYKDIDLYYCKINGNGHCIMMKNGMILDCNAKDWITRDEYTRSYNMTDLQRYWKIAVLYKRVMYKIYKLVGIVQMNLCCCCLQKIGLKVKYIQLFKPIYFCDNCKTDKASLDVIQVVAQALMIKGKE